MCTCGGTVPAEYAHDLCAMAMEESLRICTSAYTAAHDVRPSPAFSRRKEERAVNDNRQRELAYRDLERVDDEQALEPGTMELDRPTRAAFPKDDRRSSSILTERERSMRWPTG